MYGLNFHKEDIARITNTIKFIVLENQASSIRAENALQKYIMTKNGGIKVAYMWRLSKCSKIIKTGDDGHDMTILPSTRPQTTTLNIVAYIGMFLCINLIQRVVICSADLKVRQIMSI
jgi:hypothetical protein